MSKHSIPLLCSVPCRVLAVCWCLILMALPASAQSTRGTEFWIGYMTHTSPTGDPPEFTVYISTRRPNTAVISIPGSGFTQTVGIPANSVRAIALPQNLLLTIESEGIANRGVRIATTDSADVWTLSYVPRTMEGTVVLAKGALGSEYRVMAYQGFTDDANFPIASQFMIVATENATRIEITPSAVTLGGRPAGVPYTITMNLGQSYQVRSIHDLTGSRVRSLDGRPIALFGGVERANVPLGAKFQNHLFEQLFPVDRWGTVYVTVPLATRRRDVYRVVASADATTIRFNGAAAFTLNAGEYRDTILSSAQYVTADKPFGLVQFSGGSEFDGVFDADPFMMVLSPIDFTRNDVRLIMPPVPTISRHYVNVVAFTADVGTVLFDGSPVGHLFQPVPGDGFYSYATFPSPSGEHTLTSELGVIAYVYGYGQLEGYGYSAGAERLVGCPLPVIRALGDTSFCVGGSVTLDAGEGYTSYEWSTGENTRQITVSTTGEYSVITIDANGCLKPARPVSVTVSPVPEATITVVGEQALCPCDSVLLIASPAGSHRWSNGATVDTLVVREAGEYSFIVTNEFGCTASSDTVSIGRTEAASTVVLGSDSAAAGERVSIPLLLREGSGLEECDVRDFLVTLRFNASLLQIERFIGGELLSDTVIGTERFVIVEGRKAGDTLLWLDGVAALGNAPSTGLRFIWFRWGRCDLLPVRPVDGEFTLLDLCREGDPRLVDGSGEMMLKQNVPNPVGESATIEYEIVEDGPTTLFVTDVAGRTIHTLHSGYRPRGRYTATLDASALPSGTYYYILETPTQRLGRVMRVVR